MVCTLSVFSGTYDYEVSIRGEPKIKECIQAVANLDLMKFLRPNDASSWISFLH